MDNFEKIKQRGFVLYSDFGAVGDGIAEDHEAIRRAHEFANENSLPVKADKGKTYYVGLTQGPAVIKTPTDFNEATFIIDNTNMTGTESSYTFVIVSDYEDEIYEAGSDIVKAFNDSKDENGIIIRSINHGERVTKKLPLKLGYPAMVTVYDDKSTAYKRWGYVDSLGIVQEEVILIDGYGNIDKSTPALVDYLRISKVKIHKTDVTPITVQNATFLELASQHNSYEDRYNIARGIRVLRPHTTIKNLVHVIKNERPRTSCARYNEETKFWDDVTDEGFSYDVVARRVLKNGEAYTGSDVKRFCGHTCTGYISVVGTHDVLVKNCVFQARVYYGVAGTYDMNCYHSSTIVYENCTQSNYYDQRERFKAYGESSYPNLSVCWGVMGSSHCKNIDFVNCVLTRFDAHCGVYNGKVIGGKIGVLRLIGGGEFLLDGVEISRVNMAPLQLRSDYGGTFNGTLTVRNCVFKDAYYSATGKKSPIEALLDAPTAHWDNGYTTYFPNLIIDNITIDTVQTELPLVRDSKEDYSKDGCHYPIRSLLREDVHDPEATFDTYYETRDPELPINHPERVPYLVGKRAGVDYEVIDHNNGVYTLHTKNVKNICPYQPPKFIEIKNMKGAKNANGEDLTLTLYSSNFFKDTEIIDEDGVLIRNDIK